MIKNIALILSFLFCCTHINAQEKIRVACIGNSITYGSGMVNREKNSYPAQLQALLGKDYEVTNFGHSGATLLNNTNNPYSQTKAYADALVSKPNIVLIKLGTNDSKGIHRSRYNEFENTYIELINSFRKLPTNPRIILLLPVASFVIDSNDIYEPIIQKDIIPMIQDIAYKEKIEIINLHFLFIDKPHLLPDLIHPSPQGGHIIATRLYETITLKEDKKFDIFTKINQTIKVSNFNGFEVADFTFNGRNCKVVKPKVVAPNHPWIWRARFWGHEPQTDIALLERGFHLVYCDVVELFGNAESIRLWNNFYNLMKAGGLSSKVVLEGMSRGGVYVYNWALANPEKVACIYADAPVLDLKSWPGGKGTGRESKQDWEIFKADYKLDEAHANNFEGSPLKYADKIAKLNFPMLHIVGDIDDVVPVSENTAPFEEKIKANGGNITVIHKPNVGHHPHSLPDPTPIVNFILRATNQKINFVIIACPGFEYRSEPAAWIKGNDWWAQYYNIDSMLQIKKDLDILFVGNSITQGIGGHIPSITYKPGYQYFDSVFANYKWECAGISGDRVSNILWRLQNGYYATVKPKVMVITIGVNDLIMGDSPEDIAEGIKKITDWTSKNMPSTKVLLLGPLPAGLKKDDERRVKYETVHVLLAKQPQNNFTYHSIDTQFILPNGDLDQTKYGSDGIHLQAYGYKTWAIALQPLITKLLQKE